MRLRAFVIGALLVGTALSGVPAAAVAAPVTAVSVHPHDPSFLTLSTTRDRTVAVRLSPARGQDVDLQRASGGRWLPVSRTTAASTDAAATVRLPVPGRAGVTRYRAVVRATGTTAQTISAPFTVHQTDVARHRNYLVAARRAVLRFCPSTPVHVDTPSVVRGGGRPVGRAVTAIRSEDGRNTFTARIELRSGATGKALQMRALHECAHVVAARAAIEGEAEIEQARARYLWRGAGEEGQADCMAWVIARSTANLRSVDRCSATQQANARRMWHDWGWKYRGATHGWAAPPVTLPPVGTAFDYQLGGGYPPAGHVGIVVRDRTDAPAPTGYSVCYVNAFQTQPGVAEVPAHLVLRDAAGRRVADPDWPDEHLLDISTAAKRTELAALVGAWFDGCAADGFDAVEPDNLDSWMRSGGLLEVADTAAMARLLAERAHAAGLAIAQKNTVELADVDLGFDFAVSEDCRAWDECADYAAHFPVVLDVEYEDAAFAQACAAPIAGVTVVRRDLLLTTPGAADHVARWCD